ncbi:haloacid dehalogenase-like hydrolase [Catellatospora citrea]|uniref:haloacid dehalogenase-like hydrolase n=1 Tax=Catellatospora citrea TaxID=53366 RepID=UPI0014771AE0|nr:haloacid dehalogenase-like hydrolase [Catellatospora citrea]
MIDVFDFDHTIYDGDASRDFLLYCLRTQPGAWRELPRQVWAAGLFTVGLLSRDRFKERSFAVLKRLPDPAAVVGEFWAQHRHKVAKWYLAQHKAHDVIISASPEFLLAPVVTELGGVLIGTRIDPVTGSLAGHNCRGEEKVRRLRAVEPDAVVDRAYSDSLTDLPILLLAKQPFLVRNGMPAPFDTVASSADPQTRRRSRV